MERNASLQKLDQQNIGVCLLLPFSFHFLKSSTFVYVTGFTPPFFFFLSFMMNLLHGVLLLLLLFFILNCLRVPVCLLERFFAPCKNFFFPDFSSLFDACYLSNVALFPPPWFFKKRKEKKKPKISL
eukprot:TRINITY_DN3403_c0_g1_i1.p1 TRINITY_DN3403_c0_g1~~TRINITY_DN3403_c0_g1_i1.p1  ORF type:complete len:127 (+),score=3.35 TRINITY_DN3403_c0_g1_i1:95-475(+)